MAPKRVTESVWSQEIAKWTHLNHLTTSKIIGNEKQRKAALRAKADIYLVSRDNVQWLCGQFGGSMLPFDMLVIDESSSFKNNRSQRFKALRMVMPTFARVVLLTGTPSPNSLLDLWSQIYLLDRGERLGKTITRFKEDYFRPDKRNGAIIYSYKVATDGEQMIYDKISDICISMKATDHLDMPEKVDNFIELEMPEALRKQYDDFERDQVLELFSASEEITAANAAALSNKLMQFSNGAIYDENRDIHHIHDLKIDALDEIFEAAQGKPILVFYSYKHDLERILAKFGKYGAKKLENDKDVVSWNLGKIPMLVTHPLSAGHGLNLQDGGDIAVWFGLTWSQEGYAQANARLWRQGQKNTVVTHHLMTKDTIDTDVISALQRKTAKQDDLMLAVKARIKKYFKS